MRDAGVVHESAQGLAREVGGELPGQRLPCRLVRHVELPILDVRAGECGRGIRNVRRDHACTRFGEYERGGEALTSRGSVDDDRAVAESFVGHGGSVCRRRVRALRR